MESTASKKSPARSEEPEAAAGKPVCPHCHERPSGRTSKRTPPEWRAWCKVCRKRAIDARSKRERVAAKKAPRTPAPKAPKPAPAVPPPPVAQDFGAMLAHAQRCIAAVERLGGVERAERLAEALA